MIALRPALFAVCHDEEYARVSGLPVRTLNLLLAVDHRGDRDDRHAGRRAAAGQRADGGAGGRRPAGHPGLPQHDGRGDGARRLRRRRRVSGWRPTADTAPGARWCCWRSPSFLVVAVGRRRLAGACAAGRRRPPRPTPEPHEVVLHAEPDRRDLGGIGYRCRMTSATGYDGVRGGRRAAPRPVRADPAGHRQRARPAVSGACTSWWRSSARPQPLVSQHLRVLRGAGVVRGSRRGREIAYTPGRRARRAHRGGRGQPRRGGIMSESSAAVAQHPAARR